MCDGYTLLKSIEMIQNELQAIGTDEDSRMVSTLLESYQEQLKTCDSTYIETISTLRRIQMDVNKFQDNCQEIEYQIREQRGLFEQLLENKQNILVDHLNQQIQVLKTLRKDVEIKTDSMIETLREMKKEKHMNDVQIEQLTSQSNQLKTDISVSSSFSKIFASH